MRVFILSFILIALSLSGCATGFEQPGANLDYGPAPSNIEETVPSFFASSLKDPDSARYKYGTPLKGYCNQGLLFGGKLQWHGWAVGIEVNAKNSYGGYTGYEAYTILFSSSGQPIQQLPGSLTDSAVCHWL